MNYNLFSTVIDTLNLLLFPIKEINIKYDFAIQSNLEELEGDYYTFLHKDNIDKLFQSGHITEDSGKTLLVLREKIEKIDKSLWNPKEFIENIEWIEVRNIVLKLLIDLN